MARTDSTPRHPPLPELAGRLGELLPELQPAIIMSVVGDAQLQPRFPDGNVERQGHGLMTSASGLSTSGPCSRYIALAPYKTPTL